MSHSGDDSFSDAAEECYNGEFRSYPDDAWYNVRVLFAGNSGDKMRVKYDNFSDDYDNIFIADSFKSAYEVYDFIGRFRKASAQLQDPDCSMVVKGMRVCSSDSFGNDDVRFYDAIIDEICRNFTFIRLLITPPMAALGLEFETEPSAFTLTHP
ncbi:hypothetical protein Gotri_020570 [Gossypium trilobum]|uniref:SAWADEE domain-containing protein n=1 Tax=Gossypium trilobum TaxID=34281 RepID=A0A7J9D9T7_9ROSI|nr:hypothetical protein [Gossypium trilobum]